MSQPKDISSFGRVVVGMAGRGGLEYGVRLLETLRAARVELHLVLTPEAEAALGAELRRIRSLANQAYAHENQAARISSGSFLTRGMVVAPCDARALAAIAMGLATNLVYRAADVTLKEQRPLVLGLAFSPVTEIDQLNLDRARRVPHLSVLTLGGSPEDAALALLDQLNAGRD